MSKSKSVTQTGKPNKPEVLSKVKDAGVTKPAQTMKAKSKDLAKKVAGKEQKKSRKEKVKEPTPELSSGSEEDDSSDNDSEGENESDTEIQKPVANGKTNGVAKAKAHDSSDESESDDSASSESSDEEEEDEAPAKVNGSSKIAAQEDSDSEESDSSDDDATPAVAKKAALGVDSEDESDSDDSASDSEAETKPVKKTAPAQDSEDSEGSSDESDSAGEESDESEEEPKIETKVTKRKAEDNVAPLAKKTKSESADSSGSKNLFVGNLSWNIDEAWLREVFEEHGELSGARLMTDRATGRSKGFGYVEFVNAEDAATAHSAKNGFELDGRAMNVDFATGKPSEGQKQETRRKSYGDQLSEPTDTLFVGNIAFDVGQEQVTEAFSPYGTILGVRLPTDRETGAPKGFGYVNYSSIDEAKTALDAMQGFYLSSRPLRLDYSQPRPANNDSPGRGRGGFGGRGGGGFGGRGGGGFGGRGGSRGGRGGSFGNPRGGRGGARGGSTNRGGFGDFSGNKQTFND